MHPPGHALARQQGIDIFGVLRAIQSIERQSPYGHQMKRTQNNSVDPT